MKTNLVIDANILFASLIKSGETVKLLLSEKFSLYAPEFLFQEFSKYRQLIMKKTHRSAENFDSYLKIVKQHIRIIPLSMITPYLEQASTISPDPKDTVYLALAIKLNCGLWSNDKHLKDKQSQVVVLTTGDLLNLERE